MSLMTPPSHGCDSTCAYKMKFSPPTIRLPNRAGPWVRSQSGPWRSRARKGKEGRSCWAWLGNVGLPQDNNNLNMTMGVLLFDKSSQQSASTFQCFTFRGIQSILFSSGRDFGANLVHRYRSLFKILLPAKLFGCCGPLRKTEKWAACQNSESVP